MIDTISYLQFKDTTGKAEREKYAWQKLTILERTFKDEINPELDYILLRKIIQHAKTFNPTEFTEEAQSMLVEFFSSLNERIFQPGERLMLQLGYRWPLLDCTSQILSRLK